MAFPYIKVNSNRICHVNFKMEEIIFEYQYPHFHWVGNNMVRCFCVHYSANDRDRLATIHKTHLAGDADLDDTGDFRSIGDFSISAIKSDEDLRFVPYFPVKAAKTIKISSNFYKGVLLGNRVHCSHTR